MRHAKDYQCNVNGCKNKAVVFVGIADIDATEYPKCRKHADQYKLDVILALQDTKFKL